MMARRLGLMGDRRGRIKYVNRRGVIVIIMSCFWFIACEPNPDFDPSSSVLGSDYDNTTEMPIPPNQYEAMNHPWLDELIGPTHGALMCQIDDDCQVQGPWRTCHNGQCLVEPRGRTLRLEGARLQEPIALRSALNGILSDAIDGEALNLVVHLGDRENWFIQGIETGSLSDVTTYGQTPSFGAYCGASQIHCTHRSCTTVFSPDTSDRHIFVYVKTHMADSDICDFQVLRLVDVRIQVEVDIRPQEESTNEMARANIMVIGTLPYIVADDFMLDEETSLSMMMDDQSASGNSQSDVRGWPLIIAGSAQEVYFDNDPDTPIVDEPNGTHDGFENNGHRCAK